MTGSRERPTVRPETYVADYYLTTCDGHQAFLAGDQTLPARIELALRHADLRPGQRLLDVACGRGEVVRYARELGVDAVGFDYSRDAVRLATTVAEGRVLWSDARSLPFQTESFDRVVMFDAVEHLYPWELHLAFKEAGRILRPGGRLVIHTMPNLWYYRFGYPLFRIVSAIAGKPQPADPRDRWAYQHDVHVNEQTPRSLRRAIDQAGLDGRVWLEPWQHFDEDSPLMRRAKAVLTRAPGLKLIFCNDIFAIVERR